MYIHFPILYKGAFLLSLFILLNACSNKNRTAETPIPLQMQDLYLHDLEETLLAVERLQLTDRADSLQHIFLEARLKFKQTEPIMAFFKASAYKALNQPNLMIVHEGDNGIENEPPQGFQVIEELLAGDSMDIDIVRAEITNVYRTLKLEKDNVNIAKSSDYHFLWLLRDSFLRIIALGISGFDSPVLHYSLPENRQVLLSLMNYMKLHKGRFHDQKLYNQWIETLIQSAQNLNQQDFDTFDRYAFIKNHIHPLLNLWKKTVVDWGVSFPFETKLNYEAETFFDSTTFNTISFAPSYSPKATRELISLGKQLFFDKNLSGSKTMSCATCHQPEKYFTDGLTKSTANDGNPLPRNSPTLLYAALQNNQFYDARVANLENQIIDVVNGEREFHSDINLLQETVNGSETYRDKFKALYKDSITSRNIRNAIAQYIRTLVPFNSKFDRNISNKENTLTASEINGFNLFMGKAGCGTCHFAPIFNGTVPPAFSHTELEVLGVPELAVFANATVDPDSGRYNLFKADLKKFAFKTPTIRNVSKTAPYMHNGVFNTLEEVVKFYNLGGGNGIGMFLHNQTLPADTLGLSDREISDLIHFMKSLEDDLTTSSPLTPYEAD
ncbi:methylamine utilization protein [Fulvivirga sp. 29W222]|uniref:Methylamine utilization protein n=1 Tax=Fulvivirga marina TaxID=2494733 RepID=A0A937KDT1_9BACT|nr:cytochrome c peroxidase [Fulvivirga marina]MBL6448789.1 methylamine utilization protein [Fulvivirga marina]